MKEYLPDTIYMQIYQHLRRSVTKAEENFIAFQDDEDALTGALGLALIRKKKRRPTLTNGANGIGRLHIRSLVQKQSSQNLEQMG